MTHEAVRVATPVALAALAVGMLVPVASIAAERLMLAGVEASEAAYYSYVGTVLPLGAQDGGRGWFQRYWLDRYGYEYDGVPGRVEADAYGAEAALGYGGASEAGWWGVSLGVR